MKPIFAFLCLLPVLFAPSRALAADAHTTAAYLAKVEVGTYAIASWAALGGAVQTGGGIFAELPLSSRVGLRLSAEADAWRPSDSFVDRAWVDLRLYAPVSQAARLYGIAGFGYRVAGEDIMARAGGGFDVLLWKLGPVNSRFFAEGTLQASTGQYRAAALAAGINLSF